MLFSEYKQATSLLQRKQEVVVYAESRHYYQYFEKLITDLAKTEANICYITSDAKDPLLVNAPQKVKVIYVKWFLIFLFSRIRADVLIMTMPDLGTFYFKRSPDVGCYLYLFHAAVSTHQQYNHQAFFNYDAIFCTGNYQEKEIRKGEELYHLHQKEIIPYGYPLLDQIKSKSGLSNQKNIDEELVILVAPSWYNECIFETCLEELLQQLVKLPYKIILRSHPEYEKRRKNSLKKIKQLIRNYSTIQLDNLPNVIDRIPDADILITDRSGIAFEFAFGIGRPVLFIDTPLKVNNSNWEELDIQPIENSIRSELGISLSPAFLHLLPEKIKELKLMIPGFSEKIEKIGKELFFNSTSSYQKGTDYILKRINKK